MSANQIRLAVICLAANLLCSANAVASSTIQNPGGGEIEYGQVTGASSLPEAMRALLSEVDQICESRPTLGKVFRVKNTDSAAVFFTVTNVRDNNTQVAGLLIVAQKSPDDLEAAVVTDTASRFGTSVNPMLQKLFSVWQPVSGAAATVQQPEYSNTVAPLQQYVLPDQSASVSLPEGWNVSPQSGYGTIIATGPNGETALLDFPFGVGDPSNPQVQRDMQFANGPGANTSYARALYYPYNSAAGDMFASLVNQRRQKLGLPPASIQIASVEPVQSQGIASCAHITGTLDGQDAVGPKQFNTIFCRGPLSPLGDYMCLSYQTAVPVKYADAEQATMGAILASFQVNQQVVNGQTAALAAPSIRATREIGEAATKQANQAHEEEGEQEQSFESQENSEDQQSEAFNNYILGQSVISDSENGTQSTQWNDTADAMVQSDPNRYQYVNQGDFWQGVDH